jgi:penicillin G amidase
MRRAFLWSMITVAVLVFLPVGAIGGLVGWRALSRPAMSGDLALPGLAAPVELVWDHDAVPHIFAATARDAYRALGWVHARDRLWQMESQRRVGQGRLSELLGSSYIGLDTEMRGLGLYRLAEDDYAALSADTRADLDAYAAGVNAYLTLRKEPLPIEFQLLALTPEPWRPADSLVWARLISLQLSNGYGLKALRAALVDKIDPDALLELFPETSVPAPTTLSALDGVDWPRFAGNLLPALGPSEASNEWAVDGSQTLSGKPLLANDPHLGLGAPIMWYLVRLATPELNLAGATVPGLPFHILGHNDRIAWGLTTTGGDVQDLFVEDIDPQDAGSYATPDGPAKFVTRDETIKVRFHDDVHLTVRETRHGPVVSDFDSALRKAVGPTKAVALAFLGLRPHDRTIEAIRGVGRARDWTSFQDALRLWDTPEQNVIYADVDGNIALVAAGALPLRKKGTGDLPSPGADGTADWLGTTDFDQLPHAFNPSAHRLVNANNQVVPDNFPVYVAHHYAPPFRAERILEMLGAGNLFTAGDFEQMQLDVKTEDSMVLLPRLLRTPARNAAGEQALSLLRSWDQRMDRQSAAALIYMAWSFRLERALLENRLGQVLPNPISKFDFDPDLINRLLDHYSAPSDGAQPAADLLASTLDGALTGLTAAYGPEMSQWRWGDAHPAALRHRLLAEMPLVGSYFDVGLPVSGGPMTINAEEGSGGSDGTHFSSVHGPGYRGVYDLSDLSASKFIIATGESGDPFSPHFGDMTRRWRDGEYVSLTGTADAVAATGLGRQRLSPVMP